MSTTLDNKILLITIIVSVTAGAMFLIILGILTLFIAFMARKATAKVTARQKAVREEPEYSDINLSQIQLRIT